LAVDSMAAVIFIGIQGSGKKFQVEEWANEV
jgi:hypothetical protein